MIIYLDESGDLGWKFDAPYRQGGSSRFLTVAALATPTEKQHLPKRLVRDLYKANNWSSDKEKKWADMSPTVRTTFATNAANLKQAHPDIHFFAITVQKENVLAHIRQDGNKLYNYMIRLLLLDLMAKHPRVTFVPDPRSIKVASGNSLHDYLQSELWFSKNAATILTTQPTDSRHCLGLQFSDMLAGVVQSHFEDKKSNSWNSLKRCLGWKSLYFR